MQNLKKVTFSGISFITMTRIAELFKYGTDYWYWCRLRYDGTNTCGDLTIEILAAKDRSKEIPEMLLKVAEIMNNP